MAFFLVSRNIGICAFRNVGPTFLDNQFVLDKLCASEDVFVFERYEEAARFVQTIGCANQNSVGLGLMPTVDFPIFCIESTECSVRKRELPAVKQSSSSTVYVSEGVPYQYLDTATTFNQSTGFNRNDIKINKIFSVREYNYAIQYLNELPFFRALNPFSEKSSVYAFNSQGSYGAEIIDKSLSQSIYDAIKKDLDFISGLKETYNVITGVHYGLDKQGKASKGLLDFLILPLLARKLISDVSLPARTESKLLNAVACLIALPIELLRAGTGLILTIVLSPIVAAVHLIKSFCQCLIGEESNQEQISARM